MRALYPRRVIEAATAQKVTSDVPPFGIAWVERFLPRYVKRKPSRLHLDIADDLRDFHRTRGQRRCYIAPRGGAKTTWLSKAYPLYCAVEGIEPLAVLLAETGEQAQTYLSAIKKHLERNPALAMAYPAACGEGPVWRSDRITLRNGCTIVARGAGGRILGITEDDARPTLVVGDDMNQRADAYSPTLRRRKNDWFVRDVLNVGEPATNFLAAGTPIHRECVVCELKANGTWKTRSYRSVISWPTNTDLWDAWEKIVTNLAEPDRLEHGRAFYEANRVAMDEGTVVLWPDREPIYDLMLKRAEIGPPAFASEKQDTPGTDGATEYPAEYFDWPGLWFEEWPREFGHLRDGRPGKLIALDPSKGVIKAGKKAGDYQARVHLALGRDGTLYFDADLRREPVTDMVTRAIDAAATWGAAELIAEVNNTMGLLSPEFERQFRERHEAGQHGHGLLQYAELTHTEPKLPRMRRVGGYLARKQIRVRNTPGGRLLVEQWRDMPNGEYDDGPDAAGTAVKRLEQLV